MKEKTLFLISFIVMTVGLVFLFFYSGTHDLRTITNLDSALPKEKVQLQGVINKISQQEKVTFLTVLGQTIEENEIIFFPDHKITLQAGDYVKISGIIEEYNGKKEIIADEIIKKN